MRPGLRVPAARVSPAGSLGAAPAVAVKLFSLRGALVPAPQLLSWLHDTYWKQMTGVHVQESCSWKGSRKPCVPAPPLSQAEREPREARGLTQGHTARWPQPRNYQ